MEPTIEISGIVKESIVDGPGIRFVVFAQGCKHKCPGCHNPQTHSFDGGTTIKISEILDMINKNPLLDGVTFSGGEPFEQADVFTILARKIKEKGLNIMTYTGYTFEELVDNFHANKDWQSLLEESDILVDGPFILEEKDMLLKFKGSKNQRIIDIRKTLESRTKESSLGKYKVFLYE